MKVLVLNGPNLGRLGSRQPEIYGRPPTAELVELCEDWGRDLGLEVEVRQTNHEGDLLDWLNAGRRRRAPRWCSTRRAWTHYSLRALDACAQLTAPLVEVHISDPQERPEEFRHHSVVTPHAVAVVAGHGVDGYREALPRSSAEPAAGRSRRPRFRRRRRLRTRLGRRPTLIDGPDPRPRSAKADPRAWQRRTT